MAVRVWASVVAAILSAALTVGISKTLVDTAVGARLSEPSDHDRVSLPPAPTSTAGPVSTTSITPPDPAANVLSAVQIAAPSPSDAPALAARTEPVVAPPGDGRLELVDTITGEITPKSVVHLPDGRLLAQNMMYRHTVTVYGPDRNLIATIADEVRLDELGVSGFGAESHSGAPVEAVATRDGRTAFVSNYKMYGPGFDRPGTDSCSGEGWDDSFVYRIDLERYEIVDAIRVGAVPKFLALSPDEQTLLVTNWCSSDLSVVDVAAGEEMARVPIGRHPRGVAIDPAGTTAFVAVMGGRDVVRVDLRDLTRTWLVDIGASPRHLVMAPDGSALYVSLNAEGAVVKLDPSSGARLGRVATGAAPRSMVLSADGESLYVTNYDSNTLSTIETATMTEVQEVATGHHPIGVTTDPRSGEVWVANYSGSIMVFAPTGDPLE